MPKLSRATPASKTKRGTRATASKTKSAGAAAPKTAKATRAAAPKLQKTTRPVVPKTKKRTRAVAPPQVEALSAVAWSPRQLIPGTSRVFNQVETVLDSRDKQWAFWIDRTNGVFEIWFSRHRLKRPWQTASLFVPARGIQELSVATLNELKLVAWQELPAGGPKRIGYVEFEVNPGSPVYLRNNTNQHDAYPRVASAPDGTRYITWARGDQIFLAQSQDGKNWAMEPVTPTKGYTRPNLAFDTSTGTLHIVYMKLEGAQLFYTRRGANATAWEREQVLGRGKDFEIVARNGKVLVTWGNSNDNHQLALRVFENNRWSGPMCPPGVTVSGYAPHGVIDAQGNPHLTWQQYIGGNEQYNTYFSEFVDGQWTPAVPFEGRTGNHRGNDLALDSEGGLHAVYMEHGAGDFVFSTDRPLMS